MPFHNEGVAIPKTSDTLSIDDAREAVAEHKHAAWAFHRPAVARAQGAKSESARLGDGPTFTPAARSRWYGVASARIQPPPARTSRRFGWPSSTGSR